MDCRGGTTAACNGGDPITWTSFNKPEVVYDGSDIAKFDYGADRRLIMQQSFGGPIYRRTSYVGSHFETGVDGTDTTRWRINVFANGQVIYQIAEYQTVDECETTVGSQGYFVLRDHQNSVDVLLNDGSGSDVQYSFDAFGKRRYVANYAPDATDFLLNINHTSKRGYTGHEHVDNVRLIHMKGRVQDPILGRMISADPWMGDIRNPQTLNSYSYVLNNPVSLVDPSGFCPEGVDAGAECPAAEHFDEITILPAFQGSWWAEDYFGSGRVQRENAVLGYINDNWRQLKRTNMLLARVFAGIDEIVVTVENLSQGNGRLTQVNVNIGGLIFAQFWTPSDEVNALVFGILNAVVATPTGELLVAWQQQNGRQLVLAVNSGAVGDTGSRNFTWPLAENVGASFVDTGSAEIMDVDLGAGERLVTAPFGRVLTHEVVHAVRPDLTGSQVITITNSMRAAWGGTLIRDPNDH